jgi:hypothetical protein
VICQSKDGPELVESVKYKFGKSHLSENSVDKGFGYNNVCLIFKIFATIQTHTKNDQQLEYPPVKHYLLYHYRGFVTEIGNQIVHKMNSNLHLHIAKTWIRENKVSIANDELDKEIGEICKYLVEDEKLKSLKELFRTKVNALKTALTNSDQIIIAYDMQHVAEEIYKNSSKSDNAEKLAFFLDLFVANLFNFGDIQHIRDDAYNWRMRMTIVP